MTYERSLLQLMVPEEKESITVARRHGSKHGSRDRKLRENREQTGNRTSQCPPPIGVLPPASLHHLNLPKERHLLGKKCANAGAYSKHHTHSWPGPLLLLFYTTHTHMALLLLPHGGYHLCELTCALPWSWCNGQETHEHL